MAGKTAPGAGTPARGYIGRNSGVIVPFPRQRAPHRGIDEAARRGAATTPGYVATTQVIKPAGIASAVPLKSDHWIATTDVLARSDETFRRFIDGALRDFNATKNPVSNRAARIRLKVLRRIQTPLSSGIAAPISQVFASFQSARRRQT